MAGKVTKAEKLERVDAVLDLLLQSVSRRGILQFFANKGWDVSPRTVDWYIQQARKELVELSRQRREDEFALAREQLAMLLMRALAKGDLRTARLVRRDLTELLGLLVEPVHRVAFVSEAEPRAGAMPLERLTDDERELYFDLFEKLCGEEACAGEGPDNLPKGDLHDQLVLPD